MVDSPAVSDHRKGPRRRGEALCRAIFAATLDELLEVGYGELTMERIAERARTSKASLYRRWPTRADLVVAAFENARPASGALPDTGTLREDLLVLLRRAAELMNGPAGQVIRGVLADALRHPELLTVLRARVLDNRRQVLAEVLQRAVDRGQAGPGALMPQVISLGPALLRHHFMLHGAPIAEEVVVEIVDQVLLPVCAVRN